MFKIRFLSMLVLLCLTVSGAWAQTETLLTTILSADNTSFKSGSKTFDNKATVTFSGNVENDGAKLGWFSILGSTLTVTAAEGYTITRVKFYTFSNSAFDEQAPFEANLVMDVGFVTKVNGTKIGEYGGVTKIEVYGYATYYKVSVKGGTEDATSWQGKAGTGEYQALPLKRVALGTAVSVKYSGGKLVKSVKAKKVKPAAEATAEDKGKLIGADGNIYADVAAATAAGTTAVAKIIYIGTTGHATYTHGLALALTDEGQMAWGAAIDACSAKNTSTPVTDATWLLASREQWDKMITAAGSYTALRDGFSGITGASNLQSDRYWSSTEHDSYKDEAWRYDFGSGGWVRGLKVKGYGDSRVRACLAFGAQETVTLNHSANNTWAQETVTLNHSANNTWTLAATPAFDVELEVTYFNITVPTASTADIYIGSTTPLINAGSTTEDGATMKYLVTATNEQPTSTDGFSTDVPTAEGRTAGTYYVWYYLDLATGDDSNISALAVEVTVIVPTYHVTMKEGTLDADNWQGKAGTGEYQALPLTGLEAGTAVSVKYNGTKKVTSVKAKAYKMAAAATSADKGKLICTSGHIHAYGADAACTKARVAKIIYIGDTGHATYNHGLALALTDEGKYEWEAAKTACNNKNTNTPVNGATWLLASFDQWDKMMGTDGAGSYGALRDAFSSVGGSNLHWNNYWSSTEIDSDNAWYYYFGEGHWYRGSKDWPRNFVRACLAFGAQGSDPDPIELTSTDGETWTLASMPDYDVELEVTYYNTYAITVKEGTEDATSWQGKAGTGEYQALPLKRVAAGTAVSVKYNGTKLVKSVKGMKVKAAAEATAEDKGKLIGADGNIYADVAAATAAGTTAVAKIIYIGTTGHATYTRGLALALTDEGWMSWWAARDACSAKNTSTPVTGATWLLASKDQWDYMLGANGADSYTALRDGFSSVGGSNLQSGPGLYWSSTEHESVLYNEMWCYVFDDGHWGYNQYNNNCWARACLAFGAQETVTLNHSANNTWAQETVPLNHSANNTWAQETVTLNHSANNTWTLAATPASDVKLLVEYFNITVPTASTADIYAGSTIPLINAGSTTEDGATMKYLVTATNEQPTSTDGFSTDVPTAEGRTAGTYYVWYYLDFESGDDSDISAQAVEVTVSVPTYDVTMKEGTLDADNWQGKAGEGEYQALPLTGLEAGTAVSVKYNGTKKVKSVKAKKKAKPAAEATAEDKGKLIGTDGYIYADVAAATAAGTTAVAKIIYIGPTGHATYNHGLALALTDERSVMNYWPVAMRACDSKNTSTPVTDATWLLASKAQWDYMMGTDGAGSYTALRDGFSGISGASNLQSSFYWSSTEIGSVYAYDFNFDDGLWYLPYKDDGDVRARACLAFGAQGPDPIELTSTDGETWTLASMPDYDVELEVEYYDEVTLAIGTLHTRTGEVSFDSEAWYTLDGKRLNAKPNTKGIYVNNGKKVVIK